MTHLCESALSVHQKESTQRVDSFINDSSLVIWYRLEILPSGFFLCGLEFLV